MNTCGTCKYFGELVDNLIPEEDYEPVPEKARYHTCELIQHLHRRVPASRQTAPAVVIDGSDYYAVFCVSEEFGCIKWEQRS